MSQHAGPCLSEYLPFPQYQSGLLYPVLEFAQALPQPLSAGPAFDLKVPSLGLPAIVRKSQKGKLLRLLASPVRILPSKSSEFDAPRLLLRQFQPNPFELLLQTSLKTFRIVLVPKAGHEIVGETEIIRPSSTLPAHLPSEPQVQHIMQVDIRQQRRQNGPLGGAFFTDLHHPIFHDPTLEHPDDQPDHPLVSNSIPQKLDHLLVLDCIKESFDISLDYVGDLLLLDRPSQRIQTHVWHASRSVPVTAVFEYG